MTWESLLAYCLAKPGAWQDEPWEGDVVAKVGGKIFAFFGSGAVPSVGLKCGASREAADEWLLRYPDDASVMAYIGRSGWNTLRLGGAIPDDELVEAIDASYSAIVSKLPKKDRPLRHRIHEAPLRQSCWSENQCELIFDETCRRGWQDGCPGHALRPFGIMVLDFCGRGGDTGRTATSGPGRREVSRGGRGDQ
jgi:predicted DNA-binding protein (MmcQ/YjbR family)